ncbi:MAG: LapA family protein [bacterium]|nr:LapA family protein [bacterium]
MKAVLVVLVVLLALVAAFAVQNPGIIVFRFLTFSGYTSLLVVIVAAFAAGIVSAGLAGLPGFFRRRSEAGAAARRIRELEAEVGDLKGKGRAGGTTPTVPGGTQ